jgi:hypothetical protein
MVQLLWTIRKLFVKLVVDLLDDTVIPTVYHHSEMKKVST